MTCYHFSINLGGLKATLFKQTIMKVRKKFQKKNIYINPYTFKLTKESAEEFEQIADDYAIEILEYYHNGLFFIPLKDGEARKILEHIKKEKGL